MEEQVAGPSGSTGSESPTVDESVYSDDVAPVLACRPVDWSEMKLSPEVEESAIYPGSVKHLCGSCGTQVWLGPRGQEVLKKRQVDVMVFCFVCSILLDRMVGGLEVKSLENPYSRGRFKRS